jgi:hypothetical protein
MYQVRNALKEAIELLAAGEKDAAQNALERSVKLQSHYAGLLNMWDGGERMQFKNADEWIERLKVSDAMCAVMTKEEKPR